MGVSSRQGADTLSAHGGLDVSAHRRSKIPASEGLLQPVAALLSCAPMHWPWNNIDWGATLWLALIPPLLLAAMTLDILQRWRRGGWTTHLLIVACVIASTALVVTIGEHANDGLFGQTTAAWVQGVGSVMAIIGAIWIDQGSARRQAAVLKAEQNRVEEERNAALTARRQALLECNAALAIVDRDLNRASPEGVSLGPPFKFSEFALRRLKSAQVSVAYYLITPGAIPHNMVSALAGASQLVNEFTVVDEMPALNGADLADWRRRVTSARAQMKYIFDVMDFDFLEEKPDYDCEPEPGD